MILKESLILINLFDIMKKLSEEKLKEQGAFLETLTMTNVSKQTSQKLANKFVKATHVLTGLMKKEPVHIVEGFNIEELLEQNEKKWEDYKREELESKFRSLLKIRCGKLNSSCVEEELSEEALSIVIIEEAGAYYNLKDELLPSQKADFIAKFYQKEIQNIRKTLAEHKLDHQEDDEMSLKQDTQEDVKEEKLDEISEVQCLIQLGLGRNKLIRILLARWITLCVQACEGGLTVKEEILPSFQTPRERVKQDYEYQELLKQHQNNDTQYEKVLHSLLETDQNLSRRNKVIEYEEKKQLEFQAHLERMIKEYKVLKGKIQSITNKLSLDACEEETNLLEQIELQRLTKESKMIEKQINTYESMLSISAEEVEGHKKSIELIKLNKEECIAPLLKKWADKRLMTAKKLEETEENRQKDLIEKWQVAYKEFAFDEKCLKSMHNFSFHELLDIERALLELYTVKDKKALSWGEVKQKEYELFEIDFDESNLEHFYFSLYGGEMMALIYRVEEEINQVKIIKILRM